MSIYSMAENYHICKKQVYVPDRVTIYEDSHYKDWWLHTPEMGEEDYFDLMIGYCPFCGEKLR